MIKNLTNKVTALLLAVSIVLTLKVSAQTADSISTHRAQNVFAELLGAGVTFSVNYDTRFGNRRDGLGGRLGAGFFAEDGDKLFTLPMQLNYLLGKKGKYFEIGLGATYYNAKNRPENYNVFYNGSNGQYIYSEDNDDGILVVNRGNGSGLLGTMTFGYRYQPLNSGFSFRGYINPVFDSKNFIPYFFGLSFGYTFSAK
ncbi:hypothetical protein ABDD95_13340 [Mucilaginibacter sp. PAMB04274]|uniref:hypothetical protein n=1 Tax=Mucilaginibacter sp. PAMB04274 TaxID=3138568 RepID=UPI0031F60A0E